MLHTYMYLSASYTPRFSLDAFFDVDSDSDLRLELGARLGLAFSRTRAFACFGCCLPVRLTWLQLGEAAAEQEEVLQRLRLDAGTRQGAGRAGRACGLEPRPR